jgi:hypothetical protein
MINAQLEGLVKLAIDSFVESFPASDEYRRSMFELEFRRKLMKRYCTSISTSNAHTYTITPGTPMGKWTRDCPPSTSTGTILHG